MLTALTIIHSIVSALLIVLVLLQFGKGAEAGLLMDSSASSILPQRGNVMTKITSVIAILFLSLSLGLAIMRSHQAKESIFDSTKPVTAPLGTGTEAKSPEAAPSATNPAAPAAPGTDSTPGKEPK